MNASKARSIRKAYGVKHVRLARLSRFALRMWKRNSSPWLSR